MLKDHLELVLRLVMVIIAITVVLTLMVVWFKARRDRLERSSALMRARLLDAWRSGDYSAMLDTDTFVARGSIHVQGDFVAACHAAEADGWWAGAALDKLSQAAEESGLKAALRRQSRHRRAARRGLAIVIGGFPPTAIEPALIARGTRDADPTVRIAAVASLERLATDDAAAALIDGLRRAALPGPRFIERLGHPWAVPQILEALDGTNADDERVRCDLLRALSLAKDPRALPIALEIAASGTPEEQIQSMRILGAVVHDADPVAKQRIEDLAVHLAEDPHPNIRGQAIPILRNADDERSTDCLARMVSDPNWFVRKDAARALATLGESGERHLREIAQGTDRFAAERAGEELAALAAAHHHARRLS